MACWYVRSLTERRKVVMTWVFLAFEGFVLQDMIDSRYGNKI